MKSMPSPENTCVKCGNYKKEQFQTCWDCHRTQMAEENRLCGCGKLKRPEFEDCRDCGAARQERDRTERKSN